MAEEPVKHGIKHHLRMKRHKMKSTLNIKAQTKKEEFDAFNDLLVDFHNHRGTAELLHFALSDLDESLNAVSESMNKLKGATEAHFDAANVSRPAWAEKLMDALDEASEQHDRHLLTFGSHVMEPMTEYLGVLEHMLIEVKDRKQALQQQVYYQKKVESLKEHPPKDTEVLTRNEEKLKQSEMDFTAKHKHTSENIESLLTETAASAQDPLVVGLMQARKFFSGSSASLDRLVEFSTPHVDTELSFQRLQLSFKSEPFVPVRKTSLFRGRKGSTKQPGTAKRRPKKPTSAPKPLRPSHEPAQTVALGSNGASQLPAPNTDAADHRGPGPNPFDGQDIAGPGDESAKGEDSTKQEKEQPFKVVAIFGFEKTQDDEMSFVEGTELMIVDTTADEAWWLAQTLDGASKGMIPSNYVERS